MNKFTFHQIRVLLSFKVLSSKAHRVLKLSIFLGEVPVWWQNHQILAWVFWPFRVLLSSSFPKPDIIELEFDWTLSAKSYWLFEFWVKIVTVNSKCEDQFLSFLIPLTKLLCWKQNHLDTRLLSIKIWEKHFCGVSVKGKKSWVLL